MEIPALIKQRLGDEELESAVNLGDEDLICFTPSRTLLYRGEGLLSDDSLETFGHDVERLDVSEGRRKTSFTLTYVDSEERFTVARDRTESVLERLLAGILETADVIESDEDIEGVFRFSELTLVITDKRIVKHVGSYLWDADYEEYPYSEVTGLEFEEGSVATYIVISVKGRPQRIKAPRGDAELVRRALTTTLFEFYDVDSLDDLNQAIGGNAPETGETSASASSDIELDDNIAPLVTPDEEDDVETLDSNELSNGGEPAETATAGSGTEAQEPVDSAVEASDARQTTETEQTTASDDAAPVQEPAVDREDIEAMKARLATLTKVAKRQNKLLKQQQETIDQLVEELKRQQ